MDKTQENELFAHLNRTPRFRQWLELQLAQQDKVLRVNPDREQILRTQGTAQTYLSLLDKLNAADSASKRP